jgi:hypothetical protein
MLMMTKQRRRGACTRMKGPHKASVEVRLVEPVKKSTRDNQMVL